MSKKLVIPVISILMLLFALSFLVNFMGRESLETGFTGNTVKLDFIKTKCVTPVTVNEAKWEIEITLTKHGTGSMLLSRVYVNEKQVDVYGLAQGDTLIDGNQIGTSISNQGLLVEPGNNYRVFIWIGNKLLSSGSQIIIQFNDPNSITLMKSITLT